MPKYQSKAEIANDRREMAEFLARRAGELQPRPPAPTQITMRNYEPVPEIPPGRPRLYEVTRYWGDRV